MKETKPKLEAPRERRAAEKLFDYVNGSLPSQDQWAMEELMSRDSAISDAIEGLKQLDSPAEIIRIEKSLNKTISMKSMQKKKAGLKPFYFPMWILLTAIMLILISIAGYFIIELLK